MVHQVLTDASGRVHVESARGHCILTIEGAERSDEGVYSVIVRNPAGEDTADIHVKVVGKIFKHATRTMYKMFNHYLIKVKNDSIIGRLLTYKAATTKGFIITEDFKSEKRLHLAP